MRLLAALVLLTASTARPCTAFLLQGPDGPRVGKSYDWHTAEGRVVLSPAGLTKRALVIDPRDTPHTWTATHTSATFVQYGRDLPNGGLNDAGLVVEVLWLNEATPQPRDARPVVNELQWIQLQLDTHASTAEVLKHLDDARIAPVAAAVHYFVCDATAACAVIEPLGGRLVVSQGPELPGPAITNDTAAASRASLDSRRSSAGAGSLSRYRRTVEALRTPGGRDRALALLSDVEQDGYTRWQIVYEPKARRVAFRTTRTGVLHVVDLASAPKGCDSTGRRELQALSVGAPPALMLDLDAPAGATWTPWRADDNAALVTASFAALGRRVAPFAKAVAALPGTARCTR